MVSGMLVLAHRGANRLAPENTVPAVVEAVNRGADGVEFDVHRTADGALVVRHDAETPIGLVGELTRQEISEAVPGIPLVADVLDACRGRLANVEIKDPDPRAAAAVVDLLAARSTGAPDQVLVSSNDVATIDRVRALASDLPTGFVSRTLDPLSALAIALEHGHTAVHPRLSTLANVDVRAFVARAHGLGLQVNVWTVNSATEVEALRDAGVDAVITDDTELYRYGSRGGGVTGR
jgi:glycerophosphoryl diester phosphodiesterase